MMSLDGFIEDRSSVHLVIIEKFRDDLHADRFSGNDYLSPSLHVAHGVVKALRDTIGRIRQEAMYKDALALLRFVGKKLSECEQYRALIANVSRRVLSIVREEHRRYKQAQLIEHHKSIPKGAFHADVIKESSEGVCFANILNSSSKNISLSSPRAAEIDEVRWGVMKNEILSCVSEYIGELEATKTALCKQADKQVQSDETVLTYGHSRTIECFLGAAAVKRKFRVIIVESCPISSSGKMASALRNHGVNVTIIPLSSVFAVMGKVGKIILGTQLVLANGGSLAQAGSHIITLCAKEHDVPVLVISAIEKFSPYYPVDRICSAVVKCADNSEHTWKNAGNTETVLAISEVPSDIWDRVKVCYIVTDYLPPELVTLYITNEDSFAPNYAYRLISECYSPHDFDV